VRMGALPWNLPKQDMPFVRVPSHDAYLAAEICHTVRPSTRTHVPEFGMVEKPGM
jgi:hypothetical protein